MRKLSLIMLFITASTSIFCVYHKGYHQTGSPYSPDSPTSKLKKRFNDFNNSALKQFFDDKFSGSFQIIKKECIPSNRQFCFVLVKKHLPNETTQEFYILEKKEKGFTILYSKKYIWTNQKVIWYTDQLVVLIDDQPIDLNNHGLF